MIKEIKEKKILVIDDHCEQRVKPSLVREVKTEAILVFARTALERFFNKLDKEDNSLFLGTDENTKYVYGALRLLLKDLQKYVVNVEYLIELIQNTKKHPYSKELRQLAKYEEPLIIYHDTMAKKMEYYFSSKVTAIPEFIVICVLSIWFLENEKPTNTYPFIQNYDLLALIEKFELYLQKESEDTKKQFSQMQAISIEVVDALKKAKYKFNKDRTSKRKNR